jgi:peptide/nickel transport system permease protein
MLHLLPGDPVRALVVDAAIDRDTLERIRQDLGLNDPLPVRYVRFVANALVGDLGRSTQSQRPVAEEILSQLPSTVGLALAAMCLAVIACLSVGTLAAVRHKRRLDRLTMGVAIPGVSIPSFWLGLLLILTFSLALGWLPSSGTEGFDHLVMPALVLGFGATAIIARLTGSSVLEVLRQECITAARAKRPA